MCICNVARGINRISKLPACYLLAVRLWVVFIFFCVWEYFTVNIWLVFLKKWWKMLILHRKFFLVTSNLEIKKILGKKTKIHHCIGMFCFVFLRIFLLSSSLFNFVIYSRINMALAYLIISFPRNGWISHGDNLDM